MDPNGRSLKSGYAFRKRGSTSSMLLRQRMRSQDVDTAEAQIFTDWWFGSEAISFALEATEEADSFSGVLVEGQNITLAATEDADTFAGEMDAAPAATEFVLNATEEPDSASIDVTARQKPRGGVGRKNRRGVNVVDVVWPDDPRHPNYSAPVNDNARKSKEPIVVKVKAAVQAEIADQDAYDPNIAALLLLAA